jgi:hypothetical protein
VDEIVITINSSVVYKNRMFMLDIINANNWERPIYFSGGAFGADDYIWMKEYLQMDGCAFRLVPIKTVPENPRDPFDMGRIDPMYSYNVIKNWEWGNSGSPDIYHDVETRRNSVGYRSNVTRVAEALTKIGETAKAEELLDLGMEHMPLDYYGHYSMIEPFVSGYYEVGNLAKAQDLLGRVIDKYKNELDHLKVLNLNEQVDARLEIQAAIVRYNSLVEVAVFYEDQFMLDKHVEVYNSYVKAFPRFFDEDFLIRPDGNYDEEFPDAAAERELRELLETEVDNVNAGLYLDTIPETGN